MTDQEIFNTVVRGLRGQGWQRSVEGGSCRYRCDDGRKCAVGHLIPDERYSPDLEGVAVVRPSVLYALGIPHYTPVLGRLQVLHDDSGPILLEERMRRFGKKHNLEWPEE